MGGRHRVRHAHALGSIASELKAYIDALGGLWAKNRLVGKAGTGFTSTSTVHGGNESTIIALYNPMAHLGMVIVPLGYADPVLYRAGTPYGASTVSAQNAPPTPDDLEAARFQGRHVSEIAGALKAMRSVQASG